MIRPAARSFLCSINLFASVVVQWVCPSKGQAKQKASLSKTDTNTKIGSNQPEPGLAWRSRLPRSCSAGIAPSPIRPSLPSRICQSQSQVRPLSCPLSPRPVHKQPALALPLGPSGCPQAQAISRILGLGPPAILIREPGLALSANKHNPTDGPRQICDGRRACLLVNASPRGNSSLTLFRLSSYTRFFYSSSKPYSRFAASVPSSILSFPPTSFPTPGFSSCPPERSSRTRPHHQCLFVPDRNRQLQTQPRLDALSHPSSDEYLLIPNPR